jgi:hypothetical protein
MRKQIRMGVKSLFKQLKGIKKSATLRHKTGEEFDNSTGKTVSVYEDYTVDVFVTNYNSNVVDNVMISLDDSKVYLPAYQIDCVPTGEDKLVVDGKSYGLEAVQNYYDELFIIKI